MVWPSMPTSMFVRPSGRFACLKMRSMVERVIAFCAEGTI
jgi:hypothetical protein